jgi:hypothetical protein
MAEGDVRRLARYAATMDELDRKSLRRAAHELQDRYRRSFEQRGGDLSVGAAVANNVRERSKSMELHAGIEWDRSRTYDHAHVVVARRVWFSRRWRIVRSLPTAVGELDTILAGWLAAAK